MKRWLLLLLLLATPAGAQTFAYRTVPPGARVILVGPPDRVLGTSDQPLPVPSSGDLVRLRFELDGYLPAEVVLPRQALGGMRPPLVLHPQVSCRLPLAVSGAVALGLALLLLRLGRVRTLAPVERKEREGTRVGPYLLVELLGRGGAGEVYRATRQDGQPPPDEVAIKLVRPERRQQMEAERRLARETALLQRLAHPAIVRCLDSGRDGDTLYLVEELLEGGNLSALIPPQGLEPRRFLALFRPVVDAVAFAHEQGVLHRDLKPSNVLLTRGGEVRVTDFGLARGDESTIMTTNHCMGTPVYMAPELFSGQPATPLTDQYALGVVAWQMLSGQAPFQGDSVMELVAQHLKPTPRIERPVSDALQAIVLRMLEGDPADRFPSLRAVASALEQLQGGA
ncbi:MAG: serine/threonine-protein kinase [Candidatus Xenobia bacterium]